MRNLFFIVKGSYKKGAEPSVVNRVNNDTYYLGGYDPYSDDTEEWYMLVENITFTTISCSGDLDKVLDNVYKVIKKYKGDTNKFIKSVRKIDCKRSLVMEDLMKHIYDEFGDYYKEDIQKMEELAYNDLKGDTPLARSKKLVSKMKTKEVKETPKEVKPKVRLGLKKLV